MSLSFSKWSALALSAACVIVSCSADDDDDSPGTSGRGGSSGTSGATTQGGDAGDSPAGLGGVGGGGVPQLGDSGAGGAEAGGPAGGAAQGGGGASAGAGGDSGGGGEGGAPDPNVLLDADGTLRGSANGAPRALYFWGADLPAGPTSAAASACTDACLTAWPLFHASPLVLPPELDAKDFGELQRADGALQTTFKGWPLYLYAAETDETTHSGDGAQQLWHVAQQPFYSLVIMKSQTSPEQPAYLADGAGRTIYELLGDTAGSTSADPISTCTTAGCRRSWPTVSLTTAKAVSSIAGEVDIFIRPEALEFQLSYKGLPLYYYNKDELPGDLLGVGKTSWVLAVP